MATIGLKIRRRSHASKPLLMIIATLCSVVLIIFAKFDDDQKSGKGLAVDQLPFDVLTVDGREVLVVTVNSGEGSKSYMQALQNQELYARCHGYGFLNAPFAGKKSVHPFMQKALALQNIFLTEKYSKEVYDYILWIDRDAIFMDHGISISDRLNHLNTWNFREGAGADAHANPNSSVFNYDVFIAVESWAWLNSGVLLFRNTQSSRNFVNEWIRTYTQREENYKSNEKILIGSVPKTFRDLFQPKWSCEDQGALIALLAGYSQDKKWNTDRFDGLGVPHVLHKGHEQWAALSTDLILDFKYKKMVKIVAQAWINTNPWDQQKYEVNEHEQGRKSIKPFIFHFNGQTNKPALINEYSNLVKHCPATTTS